LLLAILPAAPAGDRREEGFEPLALELLADDLFVSRPRPDRKPLRVGVGLGIGDWRFAGSGESGLTRQRRGMASFVHTAVSHAIAISRTPSITSHARLPTLHPESQRTTNPKSRIPNPQPPHSAASRLLRRPCGCPDSSTR